MVHGPWSMQGQKGARGPPGHKTCDTSRAAQHRTAHAQDRRQATGDSYCRLPFGYHSKASAQAHAQKNAMPQQARAAGARSSRGSSAVESDDVLSRSEVARMRLRVA